VKISAIPAVLQVATNGGPWERNVFVVSYALREFLIRVICFSITVLMRKNLVTSRE
jgi:hypothetical protein